MKPASENGERPFDPGLNVQIVHDPLGFQYGPGIFGPKPEYRRLDSIRSSLSDPACSGPDPVYAIAMDVGKEEHRAELQARTLLFGLVTFAVGRLGEEPVRSQGHVHRISSHSGWSPPELYEIWSGRAVIYMQEFAANDPGRCFAVEAGPGDVVVVPPGWAHATLSADPARPMTFAAWCDREYGFLYDEVRKRGGLAWYAVLDAAGRLEWRPNPKYRKSQLVVGPPRDYRELGLDRSTPIYARFEQDPSSVQWVSEPGRVAEHWKNFVPCRVENHRSHPRERGGPGVVSRLGGNSHRSTAVAYGSREGPEQGDRTVKQGFGKERRTEQKIVVVVEDLIFLSKIQQTAKLTSIATETVELEKLCERLAEQQSTAAIILDLNHRSGQALDALRTIKSNPQTRRIPVIGFLSHVQADLAKAAREAGCDLLLARSAFASQLPELLRRYASLPSPPSPLLQGEPRSGV